jgi:hypothetical protein
MRVIAIRPRRRLAIASLALAVTIGGRRDHCDHRR